MLHQKRVVFCLQPFLPGILFVLFFFFLSSFTSHVTLGLDNNGVTLLRGDSFTNDMQSYGICLEPCGIFILFL
jgi:hypothetical protein